MSRWEIAKEMYRLDNEVSVTKADQMIGLVIKAVENLLVSGQDVTIHEFGTFYIERHPEGRTCADNIHKVRKRLPPHAKVKLRAAPALDLRVSTQYCKLLESMSIGAG